MMKKIIIDKENLSVEMREPEDIIFLVNKGDPIISSIEIKILFKEMTQDIGLNFLADTGSKTSIKIKTLIPKESTGNDINIHLNGFITDERSMIEFEPSFELYNNTTKISHSTTIGTIDSKWERYLRSRGFDKKGILELFNKSFDT